uniref:hypothetical protein n=1 Tax=Brucella ceti TaxID=120577 RepID=UPI0035D452BF
MSRQAKERAVESSETTALLRKEIYCLQAIVRYLREDNRRARITEQASQAWLAEPLLMRTRKEQQLHEQQKPQARAVATEARQVLGELVNMASSARVYDLGAQLPEDRLAWRPLKSS